MYASDASVAGPAPTNGQCAGGSMNASTLSLLFTAGVSLSAMSCQQSSAHAAAAPVVPADRPPARIIILADVTNSLRPEEIQASFRKVATLIHALPQETN